VNTFRFTREKEEIKSVISRAENFLNIVSFQFTDEDFIRKYILPKTNSVQIEILTLPVDSYSKEDERDRITRLYNDLEYAGVHIYKCYWEVGDPSLTTTSQSGVEKEGGGDKWYSMHGKFMYSEKEVLMMTANFSDAEELESYLLLQDQEAVVQFHKKFLYLKSMFIDERKYPGKLYELVRDEEKKYIDELHISNERLNIKEYPPNLIPEISSFSGLKITPFDGKAREYLCELINKAQNYIYLSTERLFDKKIVDVLIKRKRRNPIEIKILTCPPDQVRDDPGNAEMYVTKLLSANVDVRFYTDIHAKCWITDEVLGIGSANLSQMNLGISKSHGFWRANTETFYFANDLSLISQAKESFENFYTHGVEPIASIYKSARHLAEAKELFSSFGVTSKRDAKEAISLIKISSTIREQQHIAKIVLLSVKIAGKYDRTEIIKRDVLSALILFYLTERKHENNELFEKLKPIISDEIEYNSIIQNLHLDNFIEILDGYIKINSEQLF